MKIAIIGAGNVGGTLGQGWAKGGHTVVFGVRDPAGSGPFEGARRLPIREAVEQSEVVLLATPWSAVGDALAAAGELGDRVLIDATNPVGPGFTLTVGHTTSGGEQVAAQAKGGRVVKAFNTCGFEVMASPRLSDRAAVLFLAGDDAAARQIVIELGAELGFEPVSIGGLSRARQLEPFGLLWIRLALQLGHGRGLAFGLCRGNGEGDGARPADRRTTDPQAIAVVGTGNIGGALARAWVAAGHRVSLVVRDPASPEVQELVAAGATVGSLETARQAQVIALAIPHGAAGDLLEQLGPLPGTVVIDCTNAIAPGFQPRFGLTTSGVEELARRASGARMVKSFNQQGAETLVAPRQGGRWAVNFVAADDDAARRLVVSLAEDVGLEAVESGPLSSARLLEAVTLVWIAASQTLGTRQLGLTLLRR